MMRQTLLGIALALACGHATAVGGTSHSGRNINIHSDCEVESDYDFHLTERSVILTRDRGTPRAVVMRQGRLFVDDRWVSLAGADARRVRDYEREARATMPLAQRIARDAAQIAFTAIGEVAAGFSSDPAQTRAKLAGARARLDARLARSVTATRFSADELGSGIGDAVGEVLPTVMGDVVGGAVRAAFTGDTARLQRMERLDQEIERRIAPYTKALERDMQRLCRRMESLDRIDDAIEFRLPGGTRLELLEVRPSQHRERA
jgi:hypothetical protein